MAWLETYNCGKYGGGSHWEVGEFHSPQLGAITWVKTISEVVKWFADHGVILTEGQVIQIENYGQLRIGVE